MFYFEGPSVSFLSSFEVRCHSSEYHWDSGIQFVNESSSCRKELLLKSLNERVKRVSPVTYFHTWCESHRMPVIYVRTQTVSVKIKNITVYYS